MRRSVSGWIAAAVLAALPAACGREEAASEIELTSPSTTAEMEDAFGPAVTATAEAGADSVPRDPKAEDMAPVSLTTEPLPVPAN